MLVMKLGGSSVADRGQIEKVLGIVRSALPKQPVVVSSAHKGITNALVHAAREAAAGRFDPSGPIDRQRAVSRELGCDPALLEPLFEELTSLLRGVHLVRELSPRSLDFVSSFGERWSVRVIADFFRREGLAADAYDVWDLGFITDGVFGAARPLPGLRDRVRKAFDALPKDRVPIVTGFIGKTAQGDVTTVGRNGSDLTATLLGAALGVGEVQIWSDTDGVMSADPSLVKDARSIAEMRFDEAAELAYFGSRVLHPATLLPAMEENIPVRVLNTNRPDHPGTVIAKSASDGPRGVTSIAYKEGQIVLTLESTRMFGESGFLGKVFDVCAKHGVVVDVVTTSEVSVSLTANARGPVDLAAAELASLGEVRVLAGRSVLVVVGRDLARQPGLGAKVLGAIAGAGVNVEMISHAFGSINLSVVVRDEDVAKTVDVLHAVLFG
jgi:aspartate kinase